MAVPSRNIITTYSGLQQYLNNITKLVMEAVSNEIFQILWNNVDTLWYNRPGYTNNPSVNVRTNEILDSISKTVPELFGNKYRVEIYFDEEKINPHGRSEFPSEPFFNEHMSLDGSTEYEGRSIGSWVIEWMEIGQGLSLSSRSKAPYKGVHFFKQTLKKVGDPDSGKITAGLRDFVMKEYKKHGIKVTL